ncbi:MAG: FadR family transcriptional regulator [Gammaproteobacteria bacterium]|nr:FadR family transcriptional regulator [Gammaproteobacteria bacterium]
MQSKTTRVNGRDLGNQVAKQIARDLFSGVYKPGDMLPPETDLAESLAVSRASVRTGLQTLSALGIIRRQAGKGTVVEETHEWNMLDPQVSRWMIEYANPNPDFFRDIYEYRRAIEPYVSALAANRATAQDLAAIERAYDGMARGLKEGSTEQFTQADISFHTAIYRATHNLIWAQSVNILRPAIMLVIEKSNDTAEELSESLENHRRLMECIRLRQPEAAFNAALTVMRRTATDLGINPTRNDDESSAMIRIETLNGR